MTVLRGRLRSLTARLVLLAIALALAVTLVLGTATTLVMRHTLSDRLDDEVSAALSRALAGPPTPPGIEAPPRFIDLRNQAAGTVIAAVGVDSSQGVVVGDATGERDELDSDLIETLADVPPDGGIETVELDGLGGHRVSGRQVGDTLVVVGLPTESVDDAVAQLVVAELVLGALAVLLAGAGASLVVRRQLRPLRQVAATAHEVAALPLDSGEIHLAQRVPDALTDERTEVGQVGAALNTLLTAVGGSLTARHRSEQHVRQFVADASHELRTPLTTIAGYAELAQRRPDDVAAQRTALARVVQESARMTSLVEDLLLLARIDAGRPLEQQDVDLTRLLLEAVSDARVRAPGHQWRLDLPEESIEVVGDGRRLHQVVTNLLTNAHRHTPAGTTVTVTGRAGLIEVRDDGPGFPPSLVPHAFERFTRGDDARSQGDPGGAGGTPSGSASTGLGLSIVRAITLAHGGDVELTSTPGDTRVTVHLPVGAPA